MENRDRGKWAEAGVPHRGWICVGVEDLGEPSATCEMCESVAIRYVHAMTHPNYSEELGVGCICAEHMAEDYVGPKKREKRMRALARRRLTWLRRWTELRDGKSYLNTEGFHLKVFPRGRLWAALIYRRATGEREFSRRNYPDPEAAKMASLAALVWWKERL